MRLEQIGLRRRQPQPLAVRVAHVEIARPQRRSRLLRRIENDVGQIHALDNRPLKGRRRLGQLIIESEDRLPVRSSRRPLGQTVQADPGPLRLRQELAIGRVISGGHKTALAVDTTEYAAILEAKVVVGQEEQVVGQLVGQRAPPLFAQLGRVLAERVPDGAHAHLAAEIGVADNLGGAGNGQNGLGQG